VAIFVATTPTKQKKIKPLLAFQPIKSKFRDARGSFRQTNKAFSLALFFLHKQAAMKATIVFVALASLLALAAAQGENHNTRRRRYVSMSYT
jgi:hypothetical protein